MDTRKFTQNTTNALQSASALAREYGNQEITQAHLLCALLEKGDGLIVSLLTKMQKDVSAMKGETLSKIEKLPKVHG